MKDITTEEAIERLHDLIHTCDVGIEKHGAYDDLFALDKQAFDCGNSCEIIQDSCYDMTKDCKDCIKKYFERRII